MLSLIALTLATTQVSGFTVDATVQTPISPFIYGANNPEWDKLPGVPFTLARQGGNRMTAYNWETNASNAGNDYHHQNDGYLSESNEPGKVPLDFLKAAESHGTRAVLLTVPMAGHVSADKNGDGDVNKTPNYLETRFFKSVATKGKPFAYPPDTTDKMVYQDEFVSWIAKQKSNYTYLAFSLDNEPDLWQSTHERIVPKNLTYSEIIANNIEYAAAIKAVAPNAQTFGPANYGWQGFRRFQGASDANNRDFLDVYLDAMKAAEKEQGKRLLDVLDIHWYPEAQGDGVRITGGGPDKAGTPDARIQAPRSLWDPTYVETSWITKSLGDKPIALLPGIQAQIAAHYPGTKFAITEYNYGGGNVPSGMLAQADVLGLFGRYGLYAACNWGVGPSDPAMLAAYRAFINFDNNDSMFGDLGLKVTGGDASKESLYASLDKRKKNRMTLVAINKTKSAIKMPVMLNGFEPKSVKAYVFSSADYSKSTTGTASLSGSTVTIDCPAESVVSLEVLK